MITINELAEAYSFIESLWAQCEEKSAISVTFAGLALLSSAIATIMVGEEPDRVQIAVREALTEYWTEHGEVVDARVEIKVTREIELEATDLIRTLSQACADQSAYVAGAAGLYIIDHAIEIVRQQSIEENEEVESGELFGVLLFLLDGLVARDPSITAKSTGTMQ